MRKVTEQWEVVSSYPDQEAVDDGVLVVVQGEGKPHPCCAAFEQL